MVFHQPNVTSRLVDVLLRCAIGFQCRPWADKICGMIPHVLFVEAKRAEKPVFNLRCPRLAFLVLLRR